MRDFDAENYQSLIDKFVVSIVNSPDCDEGLLFVFSDGSVLNIGFSGCEGKIELFESKD
jgi:hypothetical protein